MNQYLDRRQFLAGLTATTAAGLSTGCSGSSVWPATQSVRKRHGGDLRVGLTGGGNDVLDPHLGLSYLDTARAQSLYEPLVQLSRDATGIEYILATEMTPRDRQGTEWVIKLRPGVRFHDGRPLTANDVVYTFQRIINGKGKYSALHVLGPVDAAGIKAPDKLTVLVPMTRPYTTLPEQLASILTAQIVPEGFTGRSRPNGTGPFRFESFTPGQRSVFTANAHYWKSGLPYVDSLTIIDFPDVISLADALTTGQVHAAGTLNGPQMATLANTAGVTAVASKAGTIVPFTMRVDRPPFTDVRVRQALRLAVDRPQLIDSALDGYGSLASDVFSPFDPDFDTGLFREQDVQQAKSLLKQAGQQDLAVTLTTSSIATASVEMATVFAEQVKAAGVRVSLQNVPPNTFFATGKYLNWPFAQDFYSFAPYIAQVTLSMLPSSPWDETHFRDPRYISLYNQANATTNGGLRREIEHDMQRIDFTSGGYIIPAYIDSLDAYHHTITGYGPSRLGQPLQDYNFARWALT